VLIKSAPFQFIALRRRKRLREAPAGQAQASGKIPAVVEKKKRNMPLTHQNSYDILLSSIEGISGESQDGEGKKDTAEKGDLKKTNPICRNRMTNTA
jgi:hypothetical protein